MFTGLVEETGMIRSIRGTPASIEFTVAVTLTGQGLKVGDSLAVNGCCLTVAGFVSKAKKKWVRIDVLQETLNVTNLHTASSGDLVNLERALPAQGRLGGHFVTGHIDGLGTITRWERTGQDYVLDITAPSEVMRYVVPKGSIAVDGISLTIAKVSRGGFRVWIIPHTYAVTALRERRVGDLVNLEADILGKYVDRLLAVKRRARSGRARRA